MILFVCGLVQYSLRKVWSFGLKFYVYIRRRGARIEFSSRSHDKIANLNRNALTIEPSSDFSQELFVRTAFTQVNPVENSSLDLNECNMCLCSLVERKRAGMPLKVTECGHVFCLDCVNRMFDNAIMYAHGLVKCPTCVRRLTRDHIIYIANIYIWSSHLLFF